MSRSKGSRGELEACKILSAWWKGDTPFSRTPGSGALATMLDNHNIGLTGDTITPEDCPFCIEIKRVDVPPWSLEQLVKSDKGLLWQWWAQCRGQANATSEKPLLLMRRNHNPWFFMMLLDDAPFPETYPGRWFQVLDPNEDQVVVGLFSDLAKIPKEEWTE